MTGKAEYNLGILGDISSKWLVYLTTVGCFAAFAEKIMNGLHIFLSLKLSQGFILFVFLYFICIAIYIIIKVFRSTKLLTLNGIALRFNYIIPITLILLTFSYWYLVNNEKVIYALSWCTIFVMYFTGLLCFCAELHNRKLNAARTEFAIVFVVSIVLFHLFFINSRHIGSGTGTAEGVFQLFEKRKKLKDSLVNLTIGLLESSASKNNTFEEKVAYKKAFLGKQLQKENKFKKDYWDSTLIDYSTEFNRYCDALFDPTGKPMPDAKSRYAISSIFRYCNDYADKLIREADTIHFIKEFDTAKFVQQSARFTNYLFITQTMGFKVQQFETRYDGVLKRQWLSHLQFVQYKGLYFFFVILIVLYTLLYLHRLQVEKLMEQETFQREQEYGSFSYKAAEVAWRITKKMSKAARIAIKREAKERQGMQYQTSIQLSEQIDSLLANGSQIKNFIFLVVLLMVPYFKVYNEKNINLDKPFLDFSLTDLLAPFKTAETVSSSADTYQKITGQINIHEEAIKNIYGDSNALVINGGVTYNYPGYGPDVNVSSYSDTAIKRILLELGKNTIRNGADRSKFVKSVEMNLQ